MKADPPTRLLLLCGLIPLPLFLIGIGIAGALTPGYDWTAQHASVLSVIPEAPLLLFKAVVITWGAMFVLFGVGLFRFSEWRSVGAICWILFGIAMCSNGIWPMGSPMHGLYALPLVSIIAPALAFGEIEALRRIPGMRAITVVVSLCAVFYLWLNLLGFDPQGYQGLTQRLFSSINSLWPAWIGFHALRGGSRVLA